MVLGALAGLGVTADLFSYNRENFFFDKERVLKRIYKGQDFAIKQYELYREDVRDLVGLTVSKMDNYLVVNTLMLTFTVILFTEGKPKPNAWPLHLQWLYCLCNVGAFMYFLMSVWLAMHASISAHSFGVRLLTQFVRLPVPSDQELDDARAKAQDYEGANAKDFLRVPVLGKQLKKQIKKLMQVMDTQTKEDDVLVGDSGSDTGSNCGDPTSPLALQRHVQLFRDMQVNWQSYDAYARVCMTMGINQFLHACGYYAVGILSPENYAPFSALSVIVMLTVASWLVLRLDLYLSKRFLVLAAFIVISAPMMSLSIVVMDLSVASDDLKSTYKICFEPVVFLLHVVWILFILRIAKADVVNGAALPKQFRAVTYLDVFGWFSQPSASEASPNLEAQSHRTSHMDLAEDSSADGILPNQNQAPPDLRGSLIRTCIKEQMKLELEILQGWSSGHSILEDVFMENPYMEQEIFQARDRFNALVSKLNEAKGDDEVEPLSFDNVPDVRVWLKLVYDSPEGSIEYYYCVQTEETLWTLPQGPEDTISELGLLKEKLNTFSEKVNALAEMSPANNLQNDGGEDDTIELGQSASRGFFPGAPRDEASTRKPPGQMPWRTFLQGSSCLVALWLLGLLWCILHVFGYDLLPIASEYSSKATPPSLELQLVFEGRWPHALFSPRSLACHASIGPVLLIAERYGVHQIRLGDAEHRRMTDSGLLHPVLSNCLRMSPGFRAGGIREISIHCNERNSTCSVLLFGSSGQAALRCPMNDGLGVDIEVHGNRWRGLTAGSDRGDFWALGASSLVLMRQKRKLNGALVEREELVPKLEIQNAALLGASHVHHFIGINASGTESVLTLDPLGLLQAWPLKSLKKDRPPPTWRLPTQLAGKFTGMCTIGRTLYLAGLHQDGMPASIWRAILPEGFMVGL